jgi:CheY-like chemotaxis protein
MNDDTHSAGPRVLVVDDHLVSRLYTVAALRQIGAAVKAVETGEEALAAAMRWRPEAVITDIHLPGLSGHELVLRIRQGWPGQRPPRIILLSADPAAHPAPGAAADVILAKPATPAQLRAALYGNSGRRIAAVGGRGLARRGQGRTVRNVAGPAAGAVPAGTGATSCRRWRQA